MNRHRTLYTLILFTLLASACGSYKKIPYYQDLKRSEVTEDVISNFSALTIQPADILGISVFSITPESSLVFNYNLNRVNGNNFDTSTDNPVTGYLVDGKGEIDLPLIGVFKVGGLTTDQVRIALKKAMLIYYKEPVVNIRILNLKVGVYGDVQRPNIYSLQNERTTITQALTLAGDLNITAKRSNIFLVREIGGKRVFIPIDLTSKKIFDSPYYYLKNNDEIYVQPDRTKYATVDRGYKAASLVLSGLSIIAIVLSNLYR